jgi:dUTP pyrophosphatase
LNMKQINIPCNVSSDLIPLYQSEGASGADLRADIKEKVVLKRGRRMLIPTGLRLEIPAGYEAQVRPRSGLAIKYGITCLNTPGTVDADYRGEIKVILINLGEEDFIIKRGDRIAQLVFLPVVRAVFKSQVDIENTERGEGGFGSTGI